MKLKHLLLVLILGTLSSAANAEFHAYQSTMEVAERGAVGAVIVDAAGRRYSFMVPSGCQPSIDEAEHAISFGNHKSILKVQWGEGFLHGLPDENTLQTLVLNRYPGAAILQSHRCTTGATSGWYFDLKRVYSADYSMTIRHAIVPCKGGSFEIVLSAASSDFRSQQGLFSTVTSSLHVVAKPELNKANE